jgi:ABC-type dipeptide/oligopeptide/nickel transport system permease subunit
MPISILASGTERAQPSSRRVSRRHGGLALLRALRRDKLALWGVIFLAMLVVVAAAGSLVARYAYDAQDLDALFRVPSVTHWLGTDQYGRDSFTRMIYGARISLSVGFAAVIGESVLGMAWGTIAGFYGGAIDHVLMRVVDLFIGFPTILLAILVTGIFGPSLVNIVVALVLTAWPGTARIIRSEVVAIREREYVDGAKALGATPSRIVLRHLAPNVVHLLIVRATLDVSSLVLAEATLSFIGIGVQPPRPSWGQMIFESFQYLDGHPLLLVFPAAALSMTVIAFNLVGEFLSRSLDPRHVSARR